MSGVISVDKFEALVNYVEEKQKWTNDRLNDLSDLPSNSNVMMHLKTKQITYLAILHRAKELREL